MDISLRNIEVEVGDWFLDADDFSEPLAKKATIISGAVDKE